MDVEGGYRRWRDTYPYRNGLASRADRPSLPYLLKAECPLEHREGCGLALRLRPLGFAGALRR